MLIKSFIIKKDHINYLNYKYEGFIIVNIKSIKEYLIFNIKYIT
jgi:hypothetical protein